jgi:catechol 2,3-dioxygenase-like lactoylglutathione lyase family enzyme
MGEHDPSQLLNQEGAKTMPARLDVIGLVVKDMARSLAFYRQLGLETPAEAEREPHVEVSLPGGLRLAFDTEETIRSFDPDWTPPSGGDRMGLAFLMETPAEVDQVYGELTSLGYAGYKEPWDAFWGQRYAIILDPDGIGVSLFAPNSAT